ncbi:MAG: hypothetical protein R6U39_01955 [Candidatus Aegiribacteria sp.]
MVPGRPEGTCRPPGNRRSACISSENRNRSFSRQISITVFSSSRVHILPTGLWGEQRMSIFAFFAFFRRSSRSRKYSPSRCRSRFSTGFLPLFRTDLSNR